MKNELKQEIEDALEVFARDPNPLFDLSDKLDNDVELNERDLEVLNVCVDFTVGTLAGYLQEIQEIKGVEK